MSSIKQWTKEQVCDWVCETIKLPQYKLAFEANEITGSVLLALKSDDLKEMGISIIGHRKQFELGIAALIQLYKQGKTVGLSSPTKSQHHAHSSLSSSLDSTFLPLSQELVIKKPQQQQVEKRKPQRDEEPEAKRQKVEKQEAAPAPPSSSVDDDTTQIEKTCPICFDDYKQDAMFALSECNQEFCRTCLKAYFTNCINTKAIPILCPDKTCKKEVKLSDLKALLDTNDMQKYEKQSLDAVVEKQSVDNSLGGLQFCYCPTPSCGFIFLYDQQEDDPHFRCEKCKQHYCLKCKCKYHTGVSCVMYRKWRREQNKEDDTFLRFVKQNRIKQCIKCHRFVEKSDGCNSITCLCGYEFCYVCGHASATCMCGKNPHSMNYTGDDDDDDEDDGNDGIAPVPTANNAEND